MSIIVTNIYNILIPICIPSSYNEFGYNDNIKKVGYATGKWKDEVKEYNKVAIILMDIRFLIDSYIERNKNTKLDKLIEKIKRVM